MMIRVRLWDLVRVMGSGKSSQFCKKYGIEPDVLQAKLNGIPGIDYRFV